MKNDTHLTVTNPVLERQVRKTIPGMAHFAGTGPRNTTCYTCVFWNTPDAHRCGKYTEMMRGKVHYVTIPAGTPSCKYYEEAKQ